MNTQSSAAQQAWGDFAPKFAELADKVLFGDIWERKELSKRDRSLATVAALVALNRTDQLRFHLQRALEQEPNADHVYYALALCCGLSGDPQGAYENLRRAIEIEPLNRMRAKQDPDLASISQQPPLDRLLFPGKKAPS